MSEQLELGPCQIWYGTAGAEVDLGSTQAIKLTISMDTADLMTAQNGTRPYDQVITGMGAEIEAPLADLDIDKMATVLPGATLINGATAGQQILKIAASVGTTLRSYAKSLILKRIVGDVASTDRNDWWTFPITAFVTNLELTFDAATQRNINALFRVFPDATTRLLGYRGHSALL